MPRCLTGPNCSHARTRHASAGAVALREFSRGVALLPRAMRPHVAAVRVRALRMTWLMKAR
jgi:hypothetical protein